MIVNYRKQDHLDTEDSKAEIESFESAIFFLVIKMSKMMRRIAKSVKK